jgi:KUP system potassium uptake protein
LLNILLCCAGLAVISVMLVTTCLMALVILIVWGRNILWALGFLLIFGSIELMYISACIMKVPQGGWVPLVLTFVFMSIMYIWNYGTVKKYEYDLQNKVTMQTLMSIGQNLGLVRVPGIGLVYTELVSAVPPIFAHFFTNLPALHDFLVLVSIKSVPVPYIPSNERYLIGRIGPKRLRMYR